MKEEELQQVKELVLEQIKKGVSLIEHREISLNDVKKWGQWHCLEKNMEKK